MAASVIKRRQWTGLERSLLRKLQNAINSINARDLRMQERAAAQDISDYYFAQDSNDPVFKAMTTVANRIQDCLLLKQ